MLVLSSLSVSLLCVCLHCTVSSAYTSVHNLATQMCHLPYNCHLHSQWARLRHTKVACHIHVSFAPALIETRRSGSLFLFHFTLSKVVSPPSVILVLSTTTGSSTFDSTCLSNLPLACSESDLNCTANGAWWQCFQHAVVGRENHPFHSRRSLSLLCRSAQLVHKNAVHTSTDWTTQWRHLKVSRQVFASLRGSARPVAKQMQQRNAIGLSTKLHLCVLTVLVMVL